MTDIIHTGVVPNQPDNALAKWVYNPQRRRQELIVDLAGNDEWFVAAAIPSVSFQDNLLNARNLTASGIPLVIADETWDVAVNGDAILQPSSDPGGGVELQATGPGAGDAVIATEGGLVGASNPFVIFREPHAYFVARVFNPGDTADEQFGFVDDATFGGVSNALYVEKDAAGQLTLNYRNMMSGGMQQIPVSYVLDDQAHYYVFRFRNVGFAVDLLIDGVVVASIDGMTDPDYPDPTKGLAAFGRISAGAGSSGGFLLQHVNITMACVGFPAV
jgi:hypothetical protein